MRNLATPHPFSALTPESSDKRLYQYIFRGEPAISGFDWHVTSNLRSSHVIATTTSSGLPLDVNRSSPCPRLAHPVSGPPTTAYSPC